MKEFPKDYKQYVFTPGLYGYIDVWPLFIANIINTELAEWFDNYKFLHFAILNVKPEEYQKHRLNLELDYSYRIRERPFDALASDALVQLDLTQYQKLTHILHLAVEKCYECYLNLTAEKVGTSIKDFEKYVQHEMVRFNKLNFPDKMKALEFVPDPGPILDFSLKINSIRNCLEHRNGFIAETDLKGSNRLCITWKYLKVQSEKGAEVKVGGEFSTEPGGLHQFVTENRCFKLGEKIRFSFHDNYKCTHTVMFILKPIIDAIFKALDTPDQETTLRRDFE